MTGATLIPISPASSNTPGTATLQRVDRNPEVVTIERVENGRPRLIYRGPNGRPYQKSLSKEQQAQLEGLVEAVAQGDPNFKLNLTDLAFSSSATQEQEICFCEDEDDEMSEAFPQEKTLVLQLKALIRDIEGNEFSFPKTYRKGRRTYVEAPPGFQRKGERLEKCFFRRQDLDHLLEGKTEEQKKTILKRYKVAKHLLDNDYWRDEAGVFQNLRNQIPGDDHSLEAQSRRKKIAEVENRLASIDQTAIRFSVTHREEGDRLNRAVEFIQSHPAPTNMLRRTRDLTPEEAEQERQYAADIALAHLEGRGEYRGACKQLHIKEKQDSIEHFFIQLVQRIAHAPDQFEPFLDSPSFQIAFGSLEREDQGVLRASLLERSQELAGVCQNHNADLTGIIAGAANPAFDPVVFGQQFDAQLAALNP